MRRIIKEENNNFKPIDHINLPRTFHRIGYFGKGSFYDAKEIEEKNSEGWRLPDDASEADFLELFYYNILKDLCEEESFSKPCWPINPIVLTNCSFITILIKIPYLHIFLQKADA